MRREGRGDKAKKERERRKRDRGEREREKERGEIEGAGRVGEGEMKNSHWVTLEKTGAPPTLQTGN